MRQLCETRPEPRGSNVDAGLGRVLHLDVEAAVRGHGGVGLAVHALVVAPRPRPAELPRGWAQQGLVLVAGGARAGVAGAGGHERGAVRGLQARPRVDGGRGVRRQVKVGGQEAREIGGEGGSLVCSVTGRSAAPSPALAASEHNTAVVGVMMEVSPVSELPRVLTQENDLWLQKIKTSKLQTQSL